MSKVEELVENLKEEAEKARDLNRAEPYPWFRIEADTLDACADELEAALKADAASVGPPPTAPLGGGCGLLRDIEGFSTEGLMEQKAAETRRESPDAEPARLWRLQEAADAAGVIIRATCVGYVVRDPDMRKRQYLDPQPTRAKALEAWSKARKVDSTTNEHKPPSTIDFEQGGHKGG